MPEYRYKGPGNFLQISFLLHLIHQKTLFFAFKMMAISNIILVLRQPTKNVQPYLTRF